MHLHLSFLVNVATFALQVTPMHSFRIGRTAVRRQCERHIHVNIHRIYTSSSFALQYTVRLYAKLKAIARHIRAVAIALTLKILKSCSSTTSSPVHTPYNPLPLYGLYPSPLHWTRCYGVKTRPVFVEDVPFALSWAAPTRFRTKSCATAVGVWPGCAGDRSMLAS